MVTTMTTSKTRNNNETRIAKRRKEGVKESVRSKKNYTVCLLACEY